MINSQYNQSSISADVEPEDTKGWLHYPISCKGLGHPQIWVSTSGPRTSPPWIPRDNCIYIQGMTVFYTWDKYYILGQLIQKENFGSCIGMLHSCYIYYRKKYLMLWKDVHSKLNLKWKLFKTYSITPFLQIIYVHSMYTKDIRRL